MLEHLHIENLAVIERADINFGNGFSVLTGETGAGKSILIDSINILLGNRASKDIIRSGCNSAVVSASFCGLSEPLKEIVSEFGLECDEDILVLQRNLSLDGKSAARVNGRQVTTSVLREIGKYLISFHGQHENNNLLDKNMHLSYLDNFAANQALLADYQKTYAVVSALRRKQESLQVDEQEKARKIELLRYQIDEIEKAELHAPDDNGEDEEAHLLQQKSLLLHREKIISALDISRLLISENETNIADQLSSVASELSHVSRYNESLSDFSDRAYEIYESVVALNEEIRDYKETYYGEEDFSSLDEIEERLDLLYRLKRKYGSNIAEILAYYEKCKEELEAVEFSEEALLKISEQLTEALSELQKKGERLSRSRKKAAADLEKQIVSELSDLAMPSVRFVCDISETQPGKTGVDSVEFLMSANPGEPLRPMTKIASGGELSRIMLSIKKVLSGTDSSETVIFDEIDTGVSGRAAQKIALKLREMSAGRQVIVVTHLAQIAALGKNHYQIEKHTDGQRTFTEIRLLDGKDRVEEVARIMGGIQITDSTLKTAEEMLAQADVL